MEEDESGIHYLSETDGGPRSPPFFLLPIFRQNAKVKFQKFEYQVILEVLNRHN
jgi:hypothetical protein